MKQCSSVRVAIGVVRNESGQILITRRKAGTVLENLWEFPGGKIEAHETPEQCVVREIKEEVDLDVEVTASFTALSHQYEHGQVQLMPRLCRLIGGCVRSLEVAEARWIDPEKLNHFEFPEANKPLIEAVMSFKTWA